MSMCNHNSVNPAIRGEGFLKNFLESSLSLQTGVLPAVKFRSFASTFRHHSPAAADAHVVDFTA